jgi:outer membrane biosynthesis protein TonB
VADPAASPAPGLSPEQLTHLRRLFARDREAARAWWRELQAQLLGTGVAVTPPWRPAVAEPTADVPGQSPPPPTAPSPAEAPAAPEPDPESEPEPEPEPAAEEQAESEAEAEPAAR